MNIAFYFVFLISLLTDAVLSQVATTSCTFPKYLSQPTALIKRLQPLVGKRYSTTDANKKFSYTVGICTKAEEGSADYAGVVQTELKPTSVAAHKYNIGQFNQAQIKGGTNWLFLEYQQGDTYESSCAKENRRASIMIICDPGNTEGELKIIEENNNKTADCYYLFELAHTAACKSEYTVEGLSIGSVIVIVFVTLVLLYLIGGFIYMRFVVGAKGMEQIPNYAFWQDFGNLLADGCNFVCRSGKRNESRSYKGVGDDQLGDDDEDDLRDDHLLPM